MRHTTDNYIFLKLLMPDALGQPSSMPTFALHAGRGRQDHSGAGQPAQGGPARVATCSAASRRRRTGPAGRFGELVTRYRCLSCHSHRRVRRRSVHRAPRPHRQPVAARLPGDYLLNPGAVRVSVEARMPVFHMLPEEARTIADYVSTVFLDDELDRYDARFTPAEAGAARSCTDSSGCVGCHQLGSTGGYVGPICRTAADGCRPGWIAAWLRRRSATSRGHCSPITAFPPRTRAPSRRTCAARRPRGGPRAAIAGERRP